MIMDRNEAIDIVKKNWSYDKHQLYEALETLIPELKESEDDRIRKQILDCFRTMKQQGCFPSKHKEQYDSWIAWLEKQDERKPIQKTESFEAEHGKYYYCIKDYFCGGKKQASKGDVVQALRGLSIIGLKDASEYFLPVNFIKCNSAWSEEDNNTLNRISAILVDASEVKNWWKEYRLIEKDEMIRLTDFLKSLKDRYTWKPSNKQMGQLGWIAEQNKDNMIGKELMTLYNDLKKINTLEVKEVDLEKEMKSWRHNHFNGKRDKEAVGEYLERVSQLDLAKHFFELGLKTIKGE